MKKKLLVFHPVIAPYRIDFFNSLNKTFDAKICLFRRRLLSQNFDYNLIENQFEFIPKYIMKEDIGVWKWIVDMWKEMRHSTPDIILTSEFNLPTIIAILYKISCRRRAKVIAMVDDSYNMVAEGNQLSRKHVWGTRMLMPWMDNVVNVEPRVRDYYQKKYHKGLYFPIICDDTKARMRLKRILPISEKYVLQYELKGKKVLLFVGRLVAVKNILMAIRAYRAIANEKTAFVIVGDGNLSGSVMAEAKDCKSIHCVGRMEGDELYAWYNIAQVFVLPSLLEPFGAVTNEALLGGCFALISNRAGSQCLVKDCVNGYIINPEDEQSLSQKIKSAFLRTEGCRLPLALRPNGMNVSFASLYHHLADELQDKGMANQ
ncbi:MAG: glycosyltransferase family 4 protein [Bacteroides sp.]